MPQMTGFMPQQQQQPYGYQQVRLTLSLTFLLLSSLPYERVLTSRRARSTELVRTPSSAFVQISHFFPPDRIPLPRPTLSPLSHVMSKCSVPLS